MRNNKHLLSVIVVIAIVGLAAGYLYFRGINQAAFKNADSGKTVQVENNAGDISAAPTETEAVKSEGSAVVSNAVELVAAIKQGAVIRLKPGDYDMNGDFTNSSQYFKEKFFTGLKNVVIEGEGGTPLNFITVDIHSPVMVFDNCENIVLRNLNMGHSPGSDGCTGDVLVIRNSKNVTVENCILFGCGVNGLTADKVDGLSFRNSVIKECSQSIMHLYNVSNVLFEASEFVGNKGGVGTRECDDIRFKDCKFVGLNYTPEFNDDNQFCYLTDKGTIQGELGGYVSAFVNSFDDWLRRIKLEDVIISQSKYYELHGTIHEGLKGVKGAGSIETALMEDEPESDRLTLYCKCRDRNQGFSQTYEYLLLYLPVLREFPSIWKWQNLRCGICV